MQAGYSDAAPGVLLFGEPKVVDGALAAKAEAILCDPLPETREVDLSTDWDFGCADDMANWTVAAWVVPVPETWRPAALCAAGVGTFEWDAGTQPLTGEMLPTASSPYASGVLFDGEDYHHTDVCGGEDSLVLVLE